MENNNTTKSDNPGAKKGGWVSGVIRILAAIILALVTGAFVIVLIFLAVIYYPALGIGDRDVYIKVVDYECNNITAKSVKRADVGWGVPIWCIGDCKAADKAVFSEGILKSSVRRRKKRFTIYVDIAENYAPLIRDTRVGFSEPKNSDIFYSEMSRENPFIIYAEEKSGINRYAGVVRYHGGLDMPRAASFDLVDERNRWGFGKDKAKMATLTVHLKANEEPLKKHKHELYLDVPHGGFRPIEGELDGYLENLPTDGYTSGISIPLDDVIKTGGVARNGYYFTELDNQVYGILVVEYSFIAGKSPVVNILYDYIRSEKSELPHARHGQKGMYDPIKQPVLKHQKCGGIFSLSPSGSLSHINASTNNARREKRDERSFWDRIAGWFRGGTADEAVKEKNEPFQKDNRNSLKGRVAERLKQVTEEDESRALDERDRKKDIEKRIDLYTTQSKCPERYELTRLVESGFASNHMDRLAEFFMSAYGRQCFSGKFIGNNLAEIGVNPLTTLDTLEKIFNYVSDRYFHHAKEDISLVNTVLEGIAENRNMPRRMQWDIYHLYDMYHLYKVGFAENAFASASISPRIFAALARNRNLDHWLAGLIVTKFHDRKKYDYIFRNLANNPAIPKNIMPETAPSFYCGAMMSKAETIICEGTNHELHEQDRLVERLTQAFLKELYETPERVDADNQAWKRKRNSCGSLKCLEDAYDKRVDYLYRNIFKKASPAAEYLDVLKNAFPQHMDLCMRDASGNTALQVLTGIYVNHRSDTRSNTKYWLENIIANGIESMDCDVAEKGPTGLSPQEILMLGRVENNVFDHSSYLIAKLISAGDAPNVQDKDRNTLVFNTDRQKLTKYLKLGVDPNIPNKQMDYPIIVYSKRPKAYGSVEDLVLFGADVNVADRDGITPLMLAATNKPYPSLVGFLLEAGADPMKLDANGLTAIDHAIEAGNRQHILWLLSYGAKPRKSDIDKMRRLMTEKQPIQGNLSGDGLDGALLIGSRAIDALLKFEPRLFSQDRINQLLFGRYLISKGLDVPLYLKRKGLVRDAKNKEGFTAMEVAQKRCDDRTVDILLRIGLNIDHDKDNERCRYGLREGSFMRARHKCLKNQGVTQRAYNIESSAIVYDEQQGLEWQRCNVGETWQRDGGCTGSSRLITTNTAAAYSKYKLNSKDGWRFPYASEFKKLYQLDCNIFRERATEKIFGKDDNNCYVVVTDNSKGRDEIETRFLQPEIDSYGVPKCRNGIGRIRLVRKRVR